MKHLFKKQPVVSWIVLAAVSLMLICNTVTQILYMEVGIVAALVKLFVPIALIVSILCLLRNARISCILNDNPIRIVVGCFCALIVTVMTLSLRDVRTSFYPLYVVTATIAFSATAYAVKEHIFSGCCCLWIELIVLCLFAGWTKDFEAVFVINIIGMVIGSLMCFRSHKKAFTKTAYCIYFCIFAMASISIVTAMHQGIIDFTVDHLYPLKYWCINGKLPSLNQFLFVGSSKTIDPLHNVLAFATGNLGTIALIGMGVLMLTVIVCSFLLLKRKHSMNLYLHVGATVAITLSFVGNVLYVCGVGNLVTRNAAFINVNLHSLIGEALLLIAILRYEPSLIHRGGKTVAAQEFASSDLDVGYDFKVYPVAVSTCREDLIEMFRVNDYDVVVKEGDLAKALEGKENGSFLEYAGDSSYIEDVFRNLSLTGDYCTVKMYTGINASSEELAALTCELLQHLPEQIAFSVTTDICEEDECRIYILVL